ncbi:MAG: bifunctional N(6)-L-threonylcarbamoyladenine synthase/serine/threonine protein kinase [Thermoplasmata archaeon]|nr:MAG: bifunctional N(6)-L-threonylcarbamoyladenine synthase/serine/threonine protein kinase [Thermoplasmata archaeon]
MLCLGIEGTAHTIGVGIVDESCNILANEYKMYSPAEGGIHPREAANHHAVHLPEMLQSAMDAAKITAKELDLIAFSQGPGLGPCLRTAATGARTLALMLNLPIIGVNHCIAHLEIGAKTGSTDPILLYVSGGNTQVIAFAHKRFRVFGETLDIGLGNMLDKFGRHEGMRFPSGKAIEDSASKSKKYVPLPYSVKGMDVAFSGILTASIQERENNKSLEDICFSIQETCFAMLTEVTERAMAHTEKQEVLLGGGVARNKRLQEMVRTMAEARDAGFFIPPPDLCIDNGAMIAWTGLIMHKAGIKMSVMDTEVRQRFRTDEVDVIWR